MNTHWRAHGQYSMFKLPLSPHRLGTGNPPTAIQERYYTGHGLKVRFAEEEISRPTDWTINASSHTVIVHLGGRMDHLETELDGKGSSFGPAVMGEVWCIPAGRRYASFAIGTSIQFAVYSIPASPSPSSPDNWNSSDFSPAAGQLNQKLLHQTQRMHEVLSQRDDLSALEAESLTNFALDTIHQSYCPPVNFASRTSRNSPEFTPDQARALREFIHDQLAHPLTLDRLASVAGMSTHVFLIAFRQALGTTPAQYILTQRLRKAQWLLLHTRLDITRIALETGFASHSHLTASFTKRLGISPRNFRARGGPC